MHLDEPSWLPLAATEWVSLLSGGSLYLLAIGLVLACFLSWLTNLITLPGNWICVLLIGLYAWLGPQSGRLSISLVTLGVTFAIAFVGEVIEFVASAAGAKNAGASTKSTIYSIFGSIVGAVVGGIVGVPIPVVGQIFAAIIFGGLGAAFGAMYGEWTDGRAWRDNWNVGQAAFWGKLFGTIGKFSVGLLIVLTVVVAVCV
ncbi:DUF456 domain-containing protein [Roseiconus lacunae]|uniref:DUF456 domain-containing protein n=1 Tax=Roseiconus lacunae TaxID=2605694 RepID=UPI0030883B38|nr:DUF456 domain-containing protein [Stieleria sp. HD01]